MKNKKNSLEKIPFDRVEGLRKAFDFKVYEMAELLGFTTRQYNRCKNQGGVLMYRYHGLKDGLMRYILEESHKKLAMLSKY